MSSKIEHLVRCAALLAVWGELGCCGVETIGKRRRRRLVQGESISAIARELGLARNTVKRALRLEGKRE